LATFRRGRPRLLENNFSSADFAMKEALNRLREFLHEAEKDVINQMNITGKNQVN
jgi:hypothetical protein